MIVKGNVTIGIETRFDQIGVASAAVFALKFGTRGPTSGYPHILKMGLHKYTCSTVPEDRFSEKSVELVLELISLWFR